MLGILHSINIAELPAPAYREQSQDTDKTATGAGAWRRTRTRFVGLRKLISNWRCFGFLGRARVSAFLNLKTSETLICLL